MKRLDECRLRTRARVVGAEDRLRCYLISKNTGSVTVRVERRKRVTRVDPKTSLVISEKVTWRSYGITTWSRATLVRPGVKDTCRN